MAVKINGWTSLIEYPLIDFGIEFNEVLSIEKHFAFIEEYLILSNLYSICRIDLEGDFESYLKYLKNTWSSLGILRPSYLPGYKYYSSQFNEPFTKLSFYENGEIVQKEVCLIGNNGHEACYISIDQRAGYFYHKEVNCSNPPWIKNHLRTPVSLTLFGAKKGEVINPRHNSLVGTIQSDIWIDKVGQLKIWNEQGTEWSFAPEVDNSEIALLNTPRLNSFLRGLKELGSKYGGKWFFESDIEVIDNHAIPIKGEIIYSPEIDSKPIA